MKFPSISKRKFKRKMAVCDKEVQNHLSLFIKESLSSVELLHVVKLKDIIITVDEECLGFGWRFVCFQWFGMILFHFHYFRICSGFLGAFFVYLNRQVVLCIRRLTALSQFLTKQWASLNIFSLPTRFWYPTDNI